MFATIISAAVGNAASGQSGGADNYSVTWILLQVFAVFCITLAGLVQLTKPKT